MADPVGMTHGIVDGDCRSLRHAKQRKTIYFEGRDHRFEVLKPSPHCDALDFPVGQATTTGVIADERIVAAQLGHPMTRE